MSTTDTDNGSPIPPWKITARVNAIMLRLLDEIERDIADGRPDANHLRAYEKLCQAEAARRA